LLLKNCILEAVLRLYEILCGKQSAKIKLGGRFQFLGNRLFCGVVFGKFSFKPSMFLRFLLSRSFLSKKADPPVIDLSDGGPLDPLVGGWCPICGRRLNASRCCPVHGVMDWVLDQDPWAGVEVVEHCGSVGLIKMEVV
jgi:hypothetical protein